MPLIVNLHLDCGVQVIEYLRLHVSYSFVFELATGPQYPDLETRIEVISIDHRGYREWLL
jgi:hypothetical protein